MRKNERRFARFYYDDFLRDYPEVYRDDAALACWWRLLVSAEKAWPADAELPRSVKASALRTLTTIGLIALGPSHTFAVRGHNAERSRRHGLAVAAAEVRHANARADAHADGDAEAPASAVPRREGDETRRDSPPPAELGRRKNGTNARALGTNARALGKSPRQEREAQKRGPTRLHEILSSIQKGPADA